MVAPYRAPRTAICEPFLVNPNRDVRVPWWPPDLTRSECGRARDDEAQALPADGARAHHLPSQVTSTRMSPCADFRGRFFELILSVIVLVSRRQPAVEEAVARVFSRVAVLERERCFFISYAEASQSKRFIFNRIYRCSVPCGTTQKIAVLAGGTRRNHPS